MLGMTLIAEMRRRGDPAFIKSGTGGQHWQHCYVGDPVVSKFLCPVAHLSTRRGLLPFKACGGSYHSRAFHVSMCVCKHICGIIMQTGKRTVGVKVKPDNTEVYVFP